MLKEASYDEFLQQQIEEGRNDSREGRVLTLEQSRELIKQLIERKSQELQNFEQEVAYG